jgi:hypothetical protein
MIQLIRDLIFGWRYKRAVKKAVKVQSLTGRKQFVIMYKGRPVVISKRKIRTLVATHYFAKGMTVQDIERKALFVTK